jgi:hypothetical protein
MGLMEFLSLPGQERTRRRDEFLGGLLNYYLGPTGIPERLGLMDMMNPVSDVGRSMTSSQEMLAPGRTPEERASAGLSMLTDIASVAAPGVATRMAGGDEAAAVTESLLGFGGQTRQGLDEATRRFLADESGALTLPGRAGGIRAYHGSPHDFDRFSMEKIGTGEGAQAYGHGLYFAEAEPVAREYRDALSGVNRLTQGGTAKSGSISDRLATMFGNDGSTWSRGDRNIGDYAKRLAVGSEKGEDGETIYRFADGSTFIDFGDFWDVSDAGYNAGRMYEVNINANPEDFLDWDRPLSEQPNVLQRLRLSTRTEQEINDEALRLMEQGNAKAGRAGGWMDDPQISARIASLNNEIDRLAPNVTGESFYRSGGQGGAADLLSQMGRGSPQLRTQELSEAGIPGIRYLDAGSRGVGEGSRNYVVFDENLIEIVRKYGIAGAATLLGVSQADIAQAMGQQQPQGLLAEGPQ